MAKKKLRLLVGIVNEKVEIIARALAAQNKFDVYLVGVGYKTTGLPSVMLAEERRLMAKLDEFIEIPQEADAREIQDIIGHVIKEKAIDLAIPLEDAIACLMADRKAHYEVAGAVVLTPDYGNIEECTYKLKAARALKRNVFVVPRFSPAPKGYASIDAIIKRLGGYPIIAKPRLGSGSMDISIHYQRFTLDARIDDFLKEPYILQQYVNGKVYSVEIVSDLQGRVIATVPKLILATDGSVATCVQIRPKPAVQDLAAKVARHFGLVGLSNIDILEGEDNQLYVIDVNPRISGSIQPVITAGINLVHLMLQVVTRRNVKSNIHIPSGIGYADAFFPYPYKEIHNMDITPEKIDELKRYENRIVKVGDEPALLKKVNRDHFIYLVRGTDDGRTFIIEATSLYKNVIIRDDKDKILFSNIGGCSKSDCRYYYPEEGNTDNAYFRLDRLFAAGEQILKRRGR